MEIIFDHVSLIINKGTPLEKTILNDISFKLENNKIYSFVGASNSGKTAIADIINALITPTSGKAYIGEKINDGRRIRKVNSLRLETGYVYKNPYDMFFNKTVKDELEFGIKYLKYRTKKMEIRVQDALKLVGLDESYLKLDPQILNLVDAKRLALACVLVYNPSIIILDEFTNGLSYKDKNEIARMLRFIKNNYNKTIILLTKDTSFAHQISDEVFLLHLTRLIAKGDRELLRDAEVLTSIGLEVPPIVSFVDACHKKNHDINYYINIQDLIKGVYNDVF
jgi:energy-coupling factor transport system ATP-binding protein